MLVNYQSIATSLLNEQNELFVINISGQCMHPILKSGDRVSVLPAGHYFPGDIVLFDHPQQGLTAHRMLGVTLSTQGWRYMTKADNTNAIDRMLEPHKILGRIDTNLSQDFSMRPSFTTRLSCITKTMKISIMLAFKKLREEI